MGYRSDQIVLKGGTSNKSYMVRGSAELGSKVNIKEERYIQSNLYLTDLKTLGASVSR